jgi:hypothetical protein
VPVTFPCITDMLLSDEMMAYSIFIDETSATQDVSPEWMRGKKGRCYAHVVYVIATMLLDLTSIGR